MSTRCGMCKHLKAINTNSFYCELTHEKMGRNQIEHKQHDWTCPDWIQRKYNIRNGKPLTLTTCPDCGREMWQRTDYCPFCEDKHMKKANKELTMPIPCMLDLIEAIFAQARRDYIKALTTMWKMEDGYTQYNEGRMSDCRTSYAYVIHFLKSGWASTLACAEINVDQLLNVMDEDAKAIYDEYKAERKAGKTYAFPSGHDSRD